MIEKFPIQDLIFCQIYNLPNLIVPLIQLFLISYNHTLQIDLPPKQVTKVERRSLILSMIQDLNWYDWNSDLVTRENPSQISLLFLTLCFVCISLLKKILHIL